MSRLTHTGADGQAKMVDVGEKPLTARKAVAQAVVVMQPETLSLIEENRLAKGDVLGTARLAGIMAAKQTDRLIPLCHSLPLDSVAVEFTLSDDRIVVTATAQCVGKTGVEMEAMTAVSIAALTLYDMAKAVDRGMRITDTRLLEKSGGKSGHFRATPL